MKNEALKSQTSVNQIKEISSVMKKITGSAFYFKHLLKCFFWSWFCSITFILLFYILTYCYLEFVGDMEYVGNRVSIFFFFFFSWKILERLFGK